MRSTPGRTARKPYTDDDYPPPPGERAVHFTDTTEAVRAWVHGWALSRGAGEPRSTPWGFTVITGPPANSTNHVLPAADETTVRELTGISTFFAIEISISASFARSNMLPVERRTFVWWGGLSMGSDFAVWSEAGVFQRAALA
nr:hypothetical protein [Streptomyces sp. FT05W]